MLKALKIQDGNINTTTEGFEEKGVLYVNLTKVLSGLKSQPAKIQVLQHNGSQIHLTNKQARQQKKGCMSQNEYLIKTGYSCINI